MARTGVTGGQGPRVDRLIKDTGYQISFDDFSVEAAVKHSLSSATWLEEADLGAAMTAVTLAQTIDAMPDRRHQLAPILIALLGNLGLLNNRKEDKSLTPQEMLLAIASGE